MIEKINNLLDKPVNALTGNDVMAMFGCVGLMTVAILGVLFVWFLVREYRNRE